MISVPEMRKKQIVMVFTHEGDKLSFSNDNIIIKDADGKIKHQSTCYKLFMLIIAGNISITSGILQRARKYGFAICLMTRTFKVYQVISNNGDGNTILRKYQYEYDDIELGKHIIRNKISNQLAILKQIRVKSSYDVEAIQYLKTYIEKLDDAETVNEIMGYEGAAARAYFERVFRDAEWKGRKPRIKSDYINSTLDIGYNLLFNFVDAILLSFGFDTYYGVLHRCFYRRKSLVCDLVEPFRVIIDKSVAKGINLGQIKESDFKLMGHRYVLSFDKSPKYVSLLMSVIINYKDDIFKYIQGYYRSFMKKNIADDFPWFEM